MDVKMEFWPKLNDTSCFKLLGHLQPSVTNYDSDSLFRIEGKSDGDKWVQTVNSLALVGVCDQLLTSLMQAVCIVLQFGNICFEQNDDDTSFISSADELAKLAEITGIEENLIAKALVTRTVVAGGQEEVFVVPLNASDAKDACDAFAKEIYHLIFHWLVRKINEATTAKSTSLETEHSQTEKSQLGVIGLLDIFGFESFQVNRFEQLCINYTNEKLQQKYIHDVFQSVIQEYEFEGLPLFQNVDVSNNSEILTLIEGRMGILDVLNEECLRPKGSNESFVSKLRTMNSDTKCLIQDRLHRPCEFAVMHYAGPVKYDATMFLTKNVDSLPMDLLKCGVECCSNSIIKTELKALLDSRMAAATSSASRSARAVTIVSKFKSQLNVLMARIGKTRTRYIRCIKPNPECTPRKMNLKLTLDQLRCAGIVAAVSVTRLAFPNRLLHETALSRFRLLIGEVSPKNTTVEAVESVFSALLKNMEVIDNGAVTKAFVCGKTRLYFRKGALELLEKKRVGVIGSLTILLQRHIRAYLSKSWYWLCLDVIVAFQSMFRCNTGTKRFKKILRATAAIACWLRCCVARKLLLDLRYNHAALQGQSMLRMKWEKVRYAKTKTAAVCIQRTTRSALCRPVYKQMLLDAKNEAVVNEKVAMLQKRLAEAEMKWFQAEKQRIEAERRFSSDEFQTGSHANELKEGLTSLNKALINESGE
jgi:myosin-5